MFKKCALLLTAFTLIPAQLPAKGSASSADLAVLKRPAVVRVVTGCEAKFVSKLDKNSKNYPINTAFTGTGFFISPDGYIATNAHLVSRQSCESGLWARLADSIIQDLRTSSGLVPDTLKTKISLIAVNADNNNEARVEIAKELKNYFTSESYKQRGKVWLAGDEFKTETNNELYGMMDIGKDYEIKKEAPAASSASDPDYGGKDVAIIKVDGINAAPTLKLADSSAVREADVVKVIGYPGIADTSFKSLPRASIMDGKISALKTWKNDVQLFQIDVLVAGGSSGSPVLNSQGEVIGMIVGYNRDLSSNDKIPFAVPVNIIKEFVGQSGTTANQESETDRLFQAGLDSLQSGSYSEAQEKFEQVKRSFPQHSEVDDLLSQTQQQRNVSTQQQRELMIPIVGIGGVSSLALLGLTWFLLRNRSQQRLQTAAASISTEPLQTRMASPKVSNFFRPSTVVKQPFLELKSSQGKDHRAYLRKPEHRLGRDRQWADLYLPDDGWEVLSRQHATLKRDGNSYRIFDYKSSNRILINGVPIPEDGHLLQSHDELQIGYDPNSQIRITYFDPGHQRSA